MKAIHKAQLSGKKRGQILILFMLALVVLILFLGLAIDLGFVYLTKSSLSKAVDSATLAGALNIGKGQDVATGIATNMFYENYRSSGRDVSPPVPIVSFTNDMTTGTTYINVSATAQINTFFIRILPQWKTLTVGSTAQGTRARAIITLVLDRSGSMTDYGGAAKMPEAVTNFLSYFDDTRDEVAMVTFSTTVSVDVPMPTTFPPQPFKSAIRSEVISMFAVRGDATFSSGGLATGLVQEAIAPVVSGENALKVVVFFTDGYANTIQDTLSCPVATSYIFGGNAPSEPSTALDFWDSSGAQCGNGCSVGPDTAVTPSACGCPCSATGFLSVKDGPGTLFTRRNITADAEYRAVQTAKAMRDNHIIVYSIGLGNDPAKINQPFLHQIANDDPSVLGYAQTPYDGKALFAPDPSQIGAVFDTVAREIALRLTR
jgi:Flp pilus assembly protein TadG